MSWCVSPWVYPVWDPLCFLDLGERFPFLYSCYSVTKSCLTLSSFINYSTLGFLSFTISLSLLRLMFIESEMPSNHLIFCCPLLLLPSIFPSIRVFSTESALHIWWPKYWSVSFSISCFSECSKLISFKIDRFDLLAFHGTLKSLLQHHSLKTSVLWHSAFFIVQLSHSYMTAGNMLGKFSTIMSSNIFSNPFSSCGTHIV